MRPTAARTLEGVAMNLLLNVIPEAKTPFGAQTIGIAASLAFMAAEEAERGANRLVVENDTVRQLLHDGLPLAGEAVGEVEAALTSPVAGDFLVSSLQAENDVLRAGLIALHAVIEANPSSETKAFNERIWAELIESTRRREFRPRL